MRAVTRRSRRRSPTRPCSGAGGRSGRMGLPQNRARTALRRSPLTVRISSQQYPRSSPPQAATTATSLRGLRTPWQKGRRCPGGHVTRQRTSVRRTRSPRPAASFLPCFATACLVGGEFLRHLVDPHAGEEHARGDLGLDREPALAEQRQRLKQLGPASPCGTS